MEINVRFRKPSAGLLPNLVGVLGLAMFAVAVGALAGDWWWSALTGGPLLVLVAYLMGQAPEAAAVAPSNVEPIRAKPAVARAG